MSPDDMKKSAGKTCAPAEHSNIGGKSLEALAGQGIVVSDDTDSEQASQSSHEGDQEEPDVEQQQESDSEAGTSDEEGEIDQESRDDEESRDRTILEFLDANPRVVQKMLAEGKYSIDKIMKDNAKKIVRIIDQNYEDFAESFAKYPQTIHKILDEEASILHNFLQQNQRAFNHYLQVKPGALAAYYEQHPAELNRLFYTNPAVLSNFCDQHPSFMSVWMKNRQATVQKYLVENPALMWNHLRAHPAYRTGGQSWAGSFTMALVIEIPEDQEHLIREPIEWTLPKDRKRRMEKLKEMAARGENAVAVRGNAAGQEFIDNDTIVQENDTLKLSSEEADYLNAEGEAERPERLNWYKGRTHYVQKHGITHAYQELDVEKPAPNTKIGPYQEAKMHVFKELHKDQQSEDGSHVQNESDAGENSDAESSSDDEHTGNHGNSSGSDEEEPPTQPPQNSPDDSDHDSEHPAQDPEMSESDSDAPLMERRNRRNRRQQQKDDEDDEFQSDTESSDSEDLPNSGRAHRGQTSGSKKRPQKKSQKSIKGLHKDFGGKRLPTDASTEAASSQLEETDPSTDFSTNESDSEDQMSDNTPARALIEYPAPFDLIEASRGEPYSSKWRLFEEDVAIGHMLNIRDEEEITGEERFRETARRLMKENSIRRTWAGVKNFWNRTGRARSGFDERKNKNAPLATSQQGKAAEARRNQMQEAQDGQSASSKSSTSMTSRSTSVDSSTAQASGQPKSKKKPMTPDTTPELDQKSLPSAESSPDFIAPKTTFSIQEVQKMQSDFSAQQVEFQAKMQEQMNAQLQLHIEMSNKQMADQMKMFTETLAAVTAATSARQTYQGDGLPNDKKRSREDLDRNPEADDIDQPAYKKHRPSKSSTDDVITVKRQDSPTHTPRKWPFGRRDTPPGGYDSRSRQETQPGDRARNNSGRRNSYVPHEIHRGRANRSWEADAYGRGRMQGQRRY